MQFYDKNKISQAREMDLLTYLMQNDPGNLVHISGGEYCTREHDSLKISNFCRMKTADCRKLLERHHFDVEENSVRLAL